MWAKETNNDQSSINELRKFGVIMSIFFATLGGLFFWQSKGYYWYFFIFSVCFLSFGLILPTALKLVYKLWMKLSMIIGFFMSRLILMILFYLVLTPTGVLLKIFGKDFLNIGFTKNSFNSYWIPRKADDSQNRDYERQF